MSKVLDFLKIAYEESCSVGGHSWKVKNWTMLDALLLAVKARFKFEKDDLKEIAAVRHWRIGRWIGDTERLYALACDENNVSAAIAYEHWQGRKPFIYQGKRLFVGASFHWSENADTPPERWYVTSFAPIVRLGEEEGHYIVCGNYKADDNPMGWQCGRPKRLIKLTIKDLKAAEKRQKEFNQGASYSAEEVQDVLCLVLESIPGTEVINAWTPEQRREVFTWAGKAYLKASDNSVTVPPCPEFLLASVDSGATMASHPHSG